MREVRDSVLTRDRAPVDTMQGRKEPTVHLNDERSGNVVMGRTESGNKGVLIDTVIGIAVVGGCVAAYFILRRCACERKSEKAPNSR